MHELTTPYDATTTSYGGHLGPTMFRFLNNTKNVEFREKSKQMQKKKKNTGVVLNRKLNVATVYFLRGKI